MPRLFVLAALFVACGSVSAQQPCTQLASAAQQVRTWADLHNFYVTFQHCSLESESIPRPAAAAIAHVTVTQWDHFHDGEKLMRSDKGFEHFLLAGINSDDDRKELKVIRHNARLDCPNVNDKFCRAIWSRARSAMVAQSPSDDHDEDSFE